MTSKKKKKEDRNIGDDSGKNKKRFLIMKKILVDPKTGLPVKPQRK